MQLVLRFDVDTPRCVRQGMRELNKLSAEFAVPFVFFVNFGRAVDRQAALSRRGANSNADTAIKLGTFAKQRFVDVVELLLRNPRLMDTGTAQIHRAIELGSEIGVHGGRNHGSWQWYFHEWGKARIAAEVEWGTRAFENVLGKSPAGFASPGWASDNRLLPVLAASGYSYVADLHGDRPHSIEAAIPNFATVLTGEPGGVGYLEHCAARRLTIEAMLEEVSTAVTRQRTPVILYDHPCFAGLGGKHLLRALLDHARSAGWSICTLADSIPSS